MEAVRLLEWLHFGILVFLCSVLTASSPQFRWLQLKASRPPPFFFLFCGRKDQISSSAVNLQKCSQHWASYYVMANLIIENPCALFHIYWQNDSLFILTAGREFVPHSNRVLIIYRQQHICLKPNHGLSLNLSELDANERRFWLTAPHKLITAHTLHYSTIRLSIIL